MELLLTRILDGTVVNYYMNETSGKEKKSRQRVARVFVSSMFMDMQKERERLVKYVFPELRRRRRERSVELVEVDLRWGINEE
jgi:hypothetical protein